MRRRLEALTELAELAALFPFLRPAGEAVESFADGAADRLGDHDGFVPVELAEEGLALVDDAERRRLVEVFAERYPEPWAELRESVGDDALTERTLVVGTVRAAIGERRPPPLRVLAEVERATDTIDTPEKALLFLLSPSGAWTVEDVAAAGNAAERAAEGEYGWMRAVDRVAADRIEAEQVGRVRVLSGHLRRRLPFNGCPRISALLAEACAEVEQDDDLAYEIAGHLLTTYLVRMSALEHARSWN